jgi:hypothetical protein
MPKTIRLSPDLTLPLSAVTEVFDILARRDSGKTYTELKMAERFVGAGLQVVSIDSMGVFWGLRAGERRVLDVLLERNGVPAHHWEVMEDSGIQSDSTFKTYINVLMRNGLATKSRDERGELVAASKEILES